MQRASLLLSTDGYHQYKQSESSTGTIKGHRRVSLVTLGIVGRTRDTQDRDRANRVCSSTSTLQTSSGPTRGHYSFCLLTCRRANGCSACLINVSTCFSLRWTPQATRKDGSKDQPLPPRLFRSFILYVKCKTVDVKRASQGMYLLRVVSYPNVYLLVESSCLLLLLHRL